MGFMLKTQVIELVPHPLLKVAADAGSRAALLLDTLKVSPFAPLSASVAVGAEPPDCEVWLAPDVTRTVGGGGFVTVTVRLAEAERPAPSTATKLRWAVPTDPTMGVIKTLQEFVELPQEAGSNCAAADGTSVALSLLSERMSLPVPVSVTGNCPELPPVMEMLLAILIAGARRRARAPTAAT